MGSSTKWLTSCCVSGRGRPPLLAQEPFPVWSSATSMADEYWFRSSLALRERICSLKLEDEVQLERGGEREREREREREVHVKKYTIIHLPCFSCRFLSNN